MTTMPELIARLKEQQTALGDGRDCRSDRERADHAARRRAYASTIRALRNGPLDIAALNAKLADLDQRRAVVVEKRDEIEREIAAFTDPMALPDARDRDREFDRQRHLKRQRERLREGSLLRAPDVAYERIADLDARIAELTKRRDAAQATLDAQVKTADALLAVPEVITR